MRCEYRTKLQYDSKSLCNVAECFWTNFKQQYSSQLPDTRYYSVHSTGWRCLDPLQHNSQLKINANSAWTSCYKRRYTFRATTVMVSEEEHVGEHHGRSQGTNPTDSSSTSHAWRSVHSTVLLQLSTAAATLSAGSCRSLSSPPWGV